MGRHGPANRSAALRNTAARSSKLQFDHSRHAFCAAQMALFTSAAPAWCTLASTRLCPCGLTQSMVAGANFLTPDHDRDFDGLPGHLRQGSLQLRAFNRAGRVVQHRLVDWTGDIDGATHGYET